jgi:hypothetical protein
MESAVFCDVTQRSSVKVHRSFGKYAEYAKQETNQIHDSNNLCFPFNDA